ncbi:MAG TPA: site-specific integrase [Ktedonobacterales bacterium]|nr:site-specific integrase [Ktedonobacterales bacterium]
MPSRRGRGEGSIYRRGDDGRWVGAFSRDGRRWTVTGATRQEAQRKLSALVREIEQGGALGDSRQTVAHYWTAWLETVKATSETAWVNHEMYTRIYVIPLLGKVRLARLSPQHLQDFYATLINETGLSSTTVHHLHTSVHKALDAAVRLGLVPRNASEYVDPPRKRHYEIQPLTRDQVRAFLAAAAGERLEALYVAALATGMRQGELLALHWADVDFEECAIYVRWNVRRRDGAFHFKQPKTRKSRRRIALAPETLEYLRAHRTRQFAERLRAGNVWEGDQWNHLVFCNEIGGPYIPSSAVRSTFTRILRRATLPRIRFHDLRHTCATLALSARVNPKVVSEMLGHSTIAITLDIYSHVLPDMQQDAVSVMAQLLYG